MAKVKLYDQTGKVTSKSIELNDSVFGLEITAGRRQMMFDAILVYRASLRQGTHKTKTRSEVRGGGRKPWRQKGTGRARQGSTRSPQWVGGGVVFGPSPRSYDIKMNRKEYRQALRASYSQALSKEKLFVLNELDFSEIKTKQATALVNGFEARKVLVITANDFENKNVELSTRNVKEITLKAANKVSVYDLVNAETLIITQDAVKQVEEVLANA